MKRPSKSNASGDKRAGRPPRAPSPPASPASQDGRALRRERNHQLIVDTCYELVRSGVVEPTAEQVAERAGLGRRTVFRQFEDMDQLAVSVNQRVTAEVSVLLEPLETSASLEADLRALIRVRARVFEWVAPFHRAGDAVKYRSPAVRSQQAIFARMTRARIEAVIGPHLCPGADRQGRLEALDLLLSFEGWERLRQKQGLSVARAVEVLHAAAHALASGG